MRAIPASAVHAKLLAVVFAAALMCILPNVGVADERQDAVAAAKRGDYAAALGIWHQLADQGDAAAQVTVGTLYHNGLGVPQNDAEAERWFRLAAEKGNADAQYKLGDLYEAGRGISRNYVEAAKWYRKAADQGDALASINLGEMYVDGRGVRRDYNEAAKLYTAAADSGDAFAQYWLGAQYLDGDNPAIPRNYVISHMWSNLSATSASDAAIKLDAIKNRNAAAKKMTTAQIAEAQAMALAWKPQPHR
jgi:TPR repeat protein